MAYRGVAAVALAELWRVGVVQAARVASDITSEDAQLETMNTSKPIPQFSFSIKGTLCTNPDLSTLQGITAKYADAVTAIKAQGQNLADVWNCRLCDVAAHQGSMHSPTITCSAKSGWITSGNIDSACFQGNGKPGWRGSYGLCLTCPTECASCETPGTTDLSYMSSRWFKCVHPIASTPWKELDPNKPAARPGLPTPVGAPWTCEAIKQRSGNRGTKQWCRYRSDLSSSVADELVPAPSGKWDVRISAAPCGGEGLGPSSSPSATIAAILSRVAEERATFFSQNCALCRIEAGGPLLQPSPTEFHRGRGGSQPWAHVACAYDEMGPAACRTDRGQTGWNKEEGCNPCPLECATCQDDSSYFGGKGFKCVLAPASSAADQVAMIMVDNHEPAGEPEPTLPQGYNCKKPEKRKCSSGKGLCMGYKTWCKYRTWGA